MYIIIAVLFLISIPFIMALFIKKEYTTGRDIIINKPKKEVFNYLKHLKNQDHFSKWVMTDPTMKKEFRGVDGTVGFVYGWNGNNKAGEGEQEIKGINEGEKIDIELRFKRPFESIGYAPFITESVSENQTKVKWQMIGANKYPLNLMNLFIDKLLGKDMEISLNNLKVILEK